MTVKIMTGYLSPSQAARAAGVDVGTLKLWMKSGKLPALMVPPGRRLYRTEDIERIARERAQKEQIAT